MFDDIPAKYKFSKYDSEKKIITKNIRFEKHVAEEINCIINFFNTTEKVKINNDFLINLMVKEFMKNNDYFTLKEQIKKEL